MTTVLTVLGGVEMARELGVGARNPPIQKAIGREMAKSPDQGSSFAVQWDRQPQKGHLARELFTI